MPMAHGVICPRPVRKLQRPLQAVSTISAVCGLIVNSVSVSMGSGKHLECWAYLPLILTLGLVVFEPRAGRTLPFRYYAAVSILSNIILFAGFLSICIINGEQMAGFRYSGDHDAIILAAYNSIPWIICGAMHLGLALLMIKDVIGLDVSFKMKIVPRNPRDHREAFSTSDTKYHHDATYSLLNGHNEGMEEENAVGDAPEQVRGAYHDHEETSA